MRSTLTHRTTVRVVPGRRTPAIGPSHPGSSFARRAPAGAATLLLLAAAPLLVGGCASKSGARADSREVRVTQDGMLKVSPRFSPDGRSVAFAQRIGDGKGMLGVFVMPVEGGPQKRISPDTLGLIPLRWTKDGQGIYCFSLEGKSLYRVGLDRSARLVADAGPLARFADVRDDGSSYLLLKFNQDNYDVCLRKEGVHGETMMPTPDWEQGATFGPGPDQITVVSASSFQSSLTTISIRSLTTPGSKPLPLPEGPKYAPCWSPDGHQMAYAVSINGQLDVWLYDSATAHATPVIQDPQDSSAPVWSPDGEWLAFCRVARTSRLFVGEPGAAGRRQLTSGPANDYEPAASPDGKWIGFMRRPPPGTEGGETPSLCVMPTAGGDVTQLDLKGLILPAKGSEFVWSWDSQSLAFSAREATTSLDVYRIHRDGTGLLRVTVDSADEIDPRWSPDGRHISYTRVGGGETQVAVVPSNGGATRVLSDERVVSEGGAWSPDGKDLAYLAARTDGGYDLWITPTAGPGRKRLALSDPELAWPLRYTPDGRDIILVRGKSPDWYVTELDLASGKEHRIAKHVMLPTGVGMYYKFLPEGMSAFKLLYPGGVVLADGEQIGDLYMVRSRDLLRSRLISSGGRGLQWFGRTSSVE